MFRGVRNRGVSMRTTRFLAVLAGFSLLVALAPPAFGGQNRAGSTVGPSEPHAVERGELPDVPAAQLGDSPGAAELEDLATIAEQEVISLDLAIERYAWQQSFAMLATSLREGYPSEYAGARIEADGSPWIAFRAAAPSAAAREIAEASDLIFGDRKAKIRIIEDRGFSEAELDARLTAAHFAALEDRDLVANASSGYDVETGAITVEIEPVDRPSSRAGRDAFVESVINDRRDVFEGVTVRVVDSMLGQDTSIYGGSALSTCTSAFAAYRRGVRGMLTAGHCPDTQKDGSVVLHTTASYAGWWGDFKFAWSSAWESDDFYSGSTTRWKTGRRDLSGTGTAVEGQRLCRNGKTSFKVCDDVYERSHCQWTTCHLTLMEESHNKKGDSGGPYFYGRTGYGVLKGTKWWGWHYRDSFSPIVYVDDAIGATVATH